MAKIYKRAMSIILAVMMMLSAIQIAATQVPMIISVSSANSLPGGTVVATVSVSENPGISSMKLSIYYDSRLTLVDATTNLEWGGTQSVTPNLTNPIVINWANPIADCFLDGTFATLTFKVPDDAEENEVYNIGILYDPDDIYNLDETNIECTVINGSITVVNCKAGDINGDQKVNNKDYSRLFQYLTGWNVIVNDSCLDVNGDGKVNNKDYSRLFQYLTGWEVEINCACGSVTKCNHSSMIEVPAVSPTCTADGNRAHWYCSVCGKYFADSLGLAETTLPEITLMATGHSLVVDSEVAATCISTGLTSGTHCDICGDIIFAQETVPVNDNAHSLTDMATCTVSQTCTLCGIVYAEAYGHTSNAGATCTDSEVCVTCGTVITSALGHKYSEEWTTDSQYHWRVCEYGDETVDVAEHAIESNGKCKTCGYIAYIPLSTPSGIRIVDDVIYWDEVDNAETYTIIANGNYKITGHAKNSCKITDLTYMVGDKYTTISTHGKISVKVMAEGYTDEDNGTVYRKSGWSDTYSDYYYVPNSGSNDSTLQKIRSYGLGYSYNLLTNTIYAKDQGQPIFDLDKLLTIGNYKDISDTQGYVETYSYSSIDEYISKRENSLSASIGLSVQSVGSLKAEYVGKDTLNYKDYKYNEVIHVESINPYHVYKIDDLSIGEYGTENEALIACLDNNFVRWVTGQNTNGLSKAELAKEIYNQYGTHVVLGVTTGASYIARYTISTNDVSVAETVKNEFKLTGEVDVKSILKVDIGLDVESSSETSWSNTSTEAHFNIEWRGSTGGATTTPAGLDKALSDYTNGINENTAVVLKLADSEANQTPSAIYIGSLIAALDPDLAEAFDAYVSEMANDTYEDWYYENYNVDLTRIVSSPEIVNNQNVVTVDLSTYQASGSLDKAEDPYLINGILQIYPIMNGQRIDKIVILGAFDEADKKNLIDGFTLELPQEWNGRTLEIEVKNLGVVCKSENGLIDLSKIENKSNISISYSGINVIKEVDGTAEYDTYKYCVADGVYEMILNTNEGEAIDLSGADMNDGYILPTCTKSKWTFAGWVDGNGIMATDDSGKLYENVSFSPTLYATWKPATYRITLEDEGATVTGTNELYQMYGKAFTYEYPQTEADAVNGSIKNDDAITIPVRTGYDFGGYYTERPENNASVDVADAGEKIIDASGKIVVAPITFDRTATLYAKWIPIEYTVIYDPNGGDGEMEPSVHRYNVSQQLNSNSFTMSHQSFVEWNTEPDGSGTAYGNGAVVDKLTTTSKGTVTLYAQWTDNIVVYLDSSSSDAECTKVVYMIPESDGFYSDHVCQERIDKISVPGKSGFKFGGYYISVENNNTFEAIGTDKVIDAEGYFTENAEDLISNGITLVPLWQDVKFTITIDNRGADTDANPTILTLIYGEAYDVTAITIPKRTGYTFIGCYELAQAPYGKYVIDRKGNIVAGVDAFTCDSTIYAYYTLRNCAITLDLNASTIKTVPQCEDIAYLQSLTYLCEGYLPVPTAEYYNFVGWYTEAGVQVSDENGYVKESPLTSDTTLYAHWKQSLEGTYIANEDELGNIGSSGTYYIVRDINITKSGVIRSSFNGILDGLNHTINGWNCVQDNVGDFGLFGSNSGTIKNLIMSNGVISTSDPDVWGTANIGLVCGKNSGTIQNVLVYNGILRADVGRIDLGGKEDAYVYCGAIVGYNTGTVTDCYVESCCIHVYAATTFGGSRAVVGGIVGYSPSGSIKGCTSVNGTFETVVKAAVKAYIFTHDHGRPRTIAGGIVGVSETATVSDNTISNNKFDLYLERDCTCGDDEDAQKAYGDYIGATEFI